MKVRNAVYCRWLLIILFVVQGIHSKAQLTANFSATPVSGCAPLLVNFTDQSTGNPTNWKWDFGNGTISFLQNPSVTYFAPGQYNVKLTVTNAGGSNEIVKSQFITVYAVPVVNFNANPLTGCFPLNVQFTDQSTAGSGTISKWEWDFGDGNLSSSQSPSHIYSGAGNFNVTARVTNSFGCVTTVTKQQYIKVGVGAKASFTFSVPNACTVPSTVSFTNTSTGSGVLSYLWDFGDNTTTAAMSPAHTYTAPGTYTIKLIVTNNTGCTDTIIKVNAVTIGNVKADFTVPSVICVGTPVAFNNTSSPIPSIASWNFGDGTSSTDVNPVKSYSAPGTYTIKMVAGFGACADSITKTISVISKPAISFSSDIKGGCRPPVTVNFTSSVTGATNYLWDFGDGSTSTQQNPSHTYTAFGVFDVKLYVNNGAGCKDSLVKPGFIRIQNPTVSLPNLPYKDCAPLTYTFNANVNSVEAVTGYLWDFGDGTTSTQQNPIHTFQTGSYTIKVTVTTAGGCTDTASVINGIYAGNKLKVDFSADPRDVCAKMPIQFTDLTTGGKADKWLWFFGDGSTSTQQHPQHQYQDTGYFDVTLIVWNNGCPDTLKFSDYIHISPPIAIFEIKGDCGAPKQKLFIDHSIGADSWEWNFGDGTTSTLQNPPLHNYADTGTYNVSLTVTNFKTGCSYTQNMAVVIGITKADFTASDTKICTGASVDFTAVHSANIASYEWRFGDGSSSADSSFVSHTYHKPGQYTVTLVISDVFGCRDSLVRDLYIKVGNPKASFTSSAPGICLNSSITFTDQSVTDGFPIQQWIWNFGDSIVQTYSAPPFQHTYAAPGNYIVSLTVVDSKGCTDSVSVLNPLIISKPKADFTTADTMSCHLQSVQFINLSSAPGMTFKYSWDFGDGIQSTDVNPLHQYTKEGVYSVRLTITDEYGCSDTIVKNNFVTVADPFADFSLSDTLSTCPPLVVSFTNLSKNFLKRSWDFGDGTSSSLDNPTHFYSIPGTYNIVLTVTGYNGCVDTKTRHVVVRGPQGSFTYSNIIGCNPLTTSFRGTTKDDISFIWDFSDGATLSTNDSVVSHTYTNPGTYVPKMILVDKGGCQVPIVGTDTIRVFGVKADFTASTTLLCDSGYVSFTDSSIGNDTVKNYLWTFGDGTSSVQKNPVHSYSATGNYITTLKVTTSQGCTDTMQLPTPIKIVSGPRIGITSNTGVCIPATITFKGELLRPDTSAVQWKWDLGNGKTSVQQYPPAQLYLNAGSYTVKAIAINSSGCKDSASRTIQTYPLPTVKTIMDSTICLGQTVTLTASGASSFQWTPSAGLSCVNCASTVARPDSNTQYIVKGTSSFGCVGWDTVSLSVRQPFKMQVGKGDTLCVGKSAQLTASGAILYKWSPSAGLSNPNIANPVATPLNTTNYKVVGMDDKGCFRDSSNVLVKVFPIPTVNAGSDKSINVGQTLDLDPVLSPDVTGTVWTPTSAIFRNRFPGITVKPTLTTEYTVEVTNEGGCKARDKVTVYVLCNNANVFIPNTFSPNGDGSNDIFYPRGTGLFSIKMFRVFNRWGQVVFENASFNANDPSAGWDGTFKGIKLNPDVFVYTIDIMCENNTILTYKGNVALIQ